MIYRNIKPAGIFVNIFGFSRNDKYYYYALSNHFTIITIKKSESQCYLYKIQPF